MKALVTGGTRGIGAAIAAELRDAGYRVTVTGSSAKAKAKAPSGCDYVMCDFASLRDVEKTSINLAKDGFSVLVNNAGINTIGRLEEYDVQDFLRIQQVNVTAPFILCKALVPGMRQRRFGRIVNVTSIYGVVSREKRSAYSTSKFALCGMSRALALEVAADNVMVNCLAPGFIDTDLTRGILGKKGMVEMAGQIPMGRLGDVKEVARYARFLASKENSYMTGQTLIADGGFTCG